MKKLKTIRKGLAYQIIRLTVLFLLIFGVVLGAISYVVFTNSLTTEYNDSAFRTAETAATMINADAIETYLAGGLQEEYAGTLAQLDSLCNKQNVTLLYTIYVDTSDYNHFRSVLPVRSMERNLLSQKPDFSSTHLTDPVLLSCNLKVSIHSEIR